MVPLGLGWNNQIAFYSNFIPSGFKKRCLKFEIRTLVNQSLKADINIVILLNVDANVEGVTLEK